VQIHIHETQKKDSERYKSVAPELTGEILLTIDTLAKREEERI